MGARVMSGEAIDAALFGMPGVEGHFIVHPEEDKDGRGHTNREAENVDKGEGLVAPSRAIAKGMSKKSKERCFSKLLAEVLAQSDKEVISEHGMGF